MVVRAIAPSAWCPWCGSVSSRTHGGYRRMLTDAPLAGRRVRIVVAVRRFRCMDACSAVTFAEQLPGLTSAFARFTPVAGGLLAAIAVALADRAGVRLYARLGLAVGPDTCEAAGKTVTAHNGCLRAPREVPEQRLLRLGADHVLAAEEAPDRMARTAAHVLPARDLALGPRRAPPPSRLLATATAATGSRPRGPHRPHRRTRAAALRGEPVAERVARRIRRTVRDGAAAMPPPRPGPPVGSARGAVPASGR